MLISILLPALSRAREQANAVKCASNLRSIGQGIAAYAAENKGTLPPSNYYKGLAYDALGMQTPTTPVNGYVHWSSFLYGDRNAFGNDAVYKTSDGWDAFQCPTIDRGGLAPANTYADNRDVPSNEAGDGVVDWQAPRLAYTLNESLAPRGIFQLGFGSRGNLRVYRFVRAGRVRNSSDTILATELSGIAAFATAPSLIDGGTTVSNSRRPVNGFIAAGIEADAPYQLRPGLQFREVTANDIDPDPEGNIGGSVLSLLSYVGRNHGGKKKLVNGRDARTSNFLYLDGHVETKSIYTTVRENNTGTFQWGKEFYSLP